MVVSRHGRYRFQTGMITASLLQRGIKMKDAVKVARAVRDSVSGRDEISSDKLSARIESVIEKTLGKDAPTQSVRPPNGQSPVPLIETSRGVYPFSKGVLLRHLGTAGLRLDEATKLVARVEAWVRAEVHQNLPEARLHEEVATLLRQTHGDDYVRRYNLTIWGRQAELPVIILLGGATGVGKSTLAMELAYRLGFAWVVSTDMIRETMRTVISPELAPGLHDHSFRGIINVGDALSDPRERVLAGFHRQAAQVGVGIRAVVTRAVREHANIIIEGTHLAPPFRQYVPAGLDAHVAGFLLAVPNEAEHRERFPRRAQTQGKRVAETYLDAFQSVRWIHDDLLRLAEEAEAVVFGNDTLEGTLAGAIDFLSQELPVEEVEPAEWVQSPPIEPAVPTLLIIVDGMADEPNPALGDKTPLAAAHTPTLCRLAGTGGQGLVATGNGREPASTDEGILALLGDGSEEASHLGRGLYEALGQGLPIPADAVLFRGNLATVADDGTILDRRAGRIRAGVEDLLADLRDIPLSGGLVGRLYPGHEHRIVVMIQGAGLSAAVCDTDPGDDAPVQRLLAARAGDDSPEASRTAEALHELLAKAREVLADHPLNDTRLAHGLPAANAILTRGASMADRRPDAASRCRGVMVSGCSTALGVARYLGMQTAKSPHMTGNLDTDLDAKFRTAAELLHEVDFVTVHIKGTDIAGHDRRPLEKRDFISSIDAALGRFLESEGERQRLRIVVTADHGTSCLTGNHMVQPVPLLLAQWDPEAEDVHEFDEESAAHGALGVLAKGELADLLGITRREDGNLSVE
ncbi:MAG: alkaline phosphatase family protein [Polyangiaceae bacterium]